MDFKTMITRMAEIGAQHLWKDSGARSILEMRGVIKARMTRSFGITAFRGYARLISDRLGIAIGDGKKAYARRAFARDEFKEWREEYSRFHGPMGRGGYR